MHARNSEGRLTEGEGRRKGERDNRKGGREDGITGMEGERERGRKRGREGQEGWKVVYRKSTGAKSLPVCFLFLLSSVDDRL